MLQPTPTVAEESARPLWPLARSIPKDPAPTKHAARIDASHLQRYCFASHDEVLEDLTLVISAVRTADRSVVRHHMQGWARDLAISAPVRDLKLWRSQEVTRALADTLGFLTADRWSFAFTYRKPRNGEPRQEHLVEPPEQPRVFMPFSNGLDSFAIAKKLRAESASLELVPVNVRAKDKPTKWSNLGHKKKLDFHTVEVAAYAPEPHRAELTFRSRPFLYDLLAGYGAAIAQPARVVIPENGQGLVRSQRMARDSLMRQLRQRDRRTPTPSSKVCPRRGRMERPDPRIANSPEPSTGGGRGLIRSPTHRRSSTAG